MSRRINVKLSRHAGKHNLQISFVTEKRSCGTIFRLREPEDIISISFSAVLVTRSPFLSVY